MACRALFVLSIACVSLAMPSLDGMASNNKPSPEVCTIYLVPIGSFSSPPLIELIAYYRQIYGVVMDVLAPVPVEAVAIDRGRRQLIAEEAVELVKQFYPDLAGDPSALFLGLTDHDMYIRGKNWRFAFAYRTQGRFAVVSTFRMNPVTFNRPPDMKLLRTRLRKMITKQLGLYYFGLPQRSDRHSALFGPIMGLDDLDSVDEEFDAVDWERMKEATRTCSL